MLGVRVGGGSRQVSATLSEDASLCLSPRQSRSASSSQASPSQASFLPLRCELVTGTEAIVRNLGRPPLRMFPCRRGTPATHPRILFFPLGAGKPWEEGWRQEAGPRLSLLMSLLSSLIGLNCSISQNRYGPQEGTQCDPQFGPGIHTQRPSSWAWDC